MNDRNLPTSSPEPREGVLVKTHVEVNDPTKYLAALTADLQVLLDEADESVEALTLIGDQGAYDRAVAAARRVTDKRAAITAFIDKEFVAPARKLWKNNLALLESATAPLDERLKNLGDATTKARKKRDDEARAAQEKALAEQREKDRLAEEERKKERDRLRKIEEDKKLELAKVAEESGDHARAAAILDAPTTVAPLPPPPPPAPAPMPVTAAPMARAAGEVRSVEWEGVVDDPLAFFKHLAERRAIWSDFLEFKKGALNTAAKKYQDKMAEYLPGLRAVSKDKTTFRR